MDIFISGSKDGITMVEGCGMEFPEDRLLNILDEALKLFTPVINLILDMKSKISKREFISNIPLDSHLCSTQLTEEIDNHSSLLNLKSKLFTQSSKQEREKRRFFWGASIYIYCLLCLSPRS
jgi:polyribonucleotide nucleotidyltransferase